MPEHMSREAATDSLNVPMVLKVILTVLKLICLERFAHAKLICLERLTNCFFRRIQFQQSCQP